MKPWLLAGGAMMLGFICYASRIIGIVNPYCYSVGFCAGFESEFINKSVITLKNNIEIYSISKADGTFKVLNENHTDSQ
ncbi:hypothetical protein DM784_08230 [Vibrio furnissii]|nr:hypothetical protein DM784_08230 [Vibrio furnissii]